MASAGPDDFDAAALETWLTANVEGFRPPASLARVTGGQSNPTYRLQGADGQRLILRSKPGPAASLLPSAHAIEREFRVMGALGKAGFPVPRLRALSDSEDVIGRAFYVMDEVEGRIFRDPALAECAPVERRALYLEFVRTLAHLHALDPDTLGLGDFGRPANYLKRNFERWAKQYRASETATIPAMEWLLDWLPRHIPDDDRRAIVHGDYKFDNVVFHSTEPRIVAVLDWELSTLGHPLADLSYAAMIYRMTPPLFRGVAGLSLEELGIPAEAEFLDAYRAEAGWEAIEDWPVYLAFSFFRSAAIVQGIKKRALDGVAASESALQEGRLAEPFAELGRRAAEGMC